MATVYIVCRDSADGPEMDCFDDPDLAQEWAERIGSRVQEEQTIGRQTLRLMMQNYPVEE
jgi:hypothetical protein